MLAKQKEKKMNSKIRLGELIKERALEKGEFQLAYGGKSKYYIDGKLITHNPEASALIGEIIYEMIKDRHVNLIGGLTMGADPIAHSVMHHAKLIHNVDIPVVTVRKEVKKHGTQKFIEGAYKAGERVVVVDDVITTGTSVITAIEKLKADGLEIVMVISIVDRESGGDENLKAYNYVPIFYIKELLDVDKQKKLLCANN